MRSHCGSIPFLCFIEVSSACNCRCRLHLVVVQGNEWTWPVVDRGREAPEPKGLGVHRLHFVVVQGNEWTGPMFDRGREAPEPKGLGVLLCRQTRWPRERQIQQATSGIMWPTCTCPTNTLPFRLRPSHRRHQQQEQKVSQTWPRLVPEDDTLATCNETSCEPS